MRPAEINVHVRKRPFVPFRMRMSDGEAYDVRHPEMVIVSRTVVAVAVPKPRAELPDLFWCDPVHIIRIEPIDGTGRRGPRKKT